MPVGAASQTFFGNESPTPKSAYAALREGSDATAAQIDRTSGAAIDSPDSAASQFRARGGPPPDNADDSQERTLRLI